MVFALSHAGRDQAVIREQAQDTIAAAAGGGGIALMTASQVLNDIEQLLRIGGLIAGIVSTIYAALYYRRKWKEKRERE